MRFLGLDVGDRRVGIAFGDSQVRIATPVDVVTRVSDDEDARAIGKFVREYDVMQLIVGLPRNMDGTTGAQAASVVTYAEKIARAVNLPVIFWDERLTTMEAMRRIHTADAPTQTLRLRSGHASPSLRRGKKSRRTLDAIAAAVILQDYMDAQGSRE